MRPRLVPLSLALSRKPHLDFVKPDDGGRDRFDRAACFDERGIRIPVAPGKHLAHFDAIERKSETGSDGLDGQAFPAARNTHDQQAFGNDFGAQTVPFQE